MGAGRRESGCAAVEELAGAAVAGEGVALEWWTVR